MTYVFTVAFYLARWVGLVVMLFVVPASDTERLIVTVGGILWVTLMWQGTRYVFNASQSMRFFWLHLRTLYPTFIAVASAHNVQNAHADALEKFKESHGKSFTELQDEGGRSRPTVNAMAQGLDEAWEQSIPAADRLEGKVFIAIAGTTLESVTLAFSALQLVGR